MDQVEIDFLRAQENIALVWLHYIDNVFFIRTHGENELKSFMEKLNQFYPYLNFNMSPVRKKSPF